MASIAFFIGALISTFLVSRLIRWLLKFKLPHEPGLLLTTAGMTLAAATLLSAFGHSTGGSLRLGASLQQYLLPVSFWLIVDLVRWKKRTGGA